MGSLTVVIAVLKSTNLVIMHSSFLIWHLLPILFQTLLILNLSSQIDKIPIQKTIKSPMTHWFFKSSFKEAFFITSVLKLFTLDLISFPKYFVCSFSVSLCSSLYFICACIELEGGLGIIFGTMVYLEREADFEWDTLR